MFKRLQKKWNVSTRQFWIIFIVFGLTGTTTAFLTKEMNSLLGISVQTWWLWKVLLKIGMLLIGYQVLLLLFGFLLGQWDFFWRYEKKLLQTLRILKKDDSQNTNGELKPGRSNSELQTHEHKRQINIAIFASGAGTNAQNIIQYFANYTYIRVRLIVCNKDGAGVLAVSRDSNINYLVISRERFFDDGYTAELKELEIDFIVLAGFLWKIPQVLIDTYRNKIINIHPALLPKYGGKGMYGSMVHKSVIDAGEKLSGITIHYVDEHYDKGDIIFQAKCDVLPTDTPETLAKKIHALEYEHFPRVIEECIKEY